MKFRALLVGLVLLLAASVASAGTVVFAWDASVGADGYRIFIRNATGTYDFSAPTWEGTALTASIELAVGEYGAVARAFSADGESANSNEILFPMESPTQTIVIPGCPKAFTLTFE